MSSGSAAGIPNGNTYTINPNNYQPPSIQQMNSMPKVPMEARISAPFKIDWWTSPDSEEWTGYKEGQRHIAYAIKPSFFDYLYLNRKEFIKINKAFAITLFVLASLSIICAVLASFPVVGTNIFFTGMTTTGPIGATIMIALSCIPLYLNRRMHQIEKARSSYYEFLTQKYCDENGNLLKKA